MFRSVTQMAQDVLGALFLLVAFAMMVLVIASVWKVFSKAGQPGWAAIVPIYNTYVMLKIGGNPGWYLLLLLIPVVNLIISIKMFIDVAKAFGQGLGMGLGLWLLPVIFFPVLGFGDYSYVGDSHGGNGGTGPGKPAV